MLKLIKRIISPPSVRLNLMIVCEVVLLLSLSLAVMFFFARQALRQEAMQDAEQTLEGTVQHIDNILLSVEQAADNVYEELSAHLDQPDRMTTYCRRLVECNPHVVGCAVAFKPYYYKDREQFMTYVHRKDDGTANRQHAELVTTSSFGSRPYTEQVWYTDPISTGRMWWTDPLEEEEDEGVTLSFCLPIFDQGHECVGVMAVDLSVDLLSQIVQAAKPSPNSYSVLLGRDGSYIVHPDSLKLAGQTVFSLIENVADPSVREVSELMLAGESGYRPFRLNDKDWYVFYRPFMRSNILGSATEKLGWSVGVVYPEDDIFGVYNRLLCYVLVISVVGLLLFFLLCRIVTRQQLKPLKQLTRSTQRIAEGHYEEAIPDTQRDDEIGQLQENFQRMQHSLASHVSELEQLTATLQDRSKVLQKAYGQIQEADRMKTKFLHYMTNQMTLPTDIIDKSVTTLCNNYQGASVKEVAREVDTINQQSEVILDLLDHMLNAADSESGKEEAYE
jgi:methyl-accepting chemotaxis protein/sigma-B regulation protein RsbU (phosphoserine phosphatase)